MKKGQWQLTTSFLHFYSDKHYVGTQPNTNINAYRGPVNIRSQFNFDLTYALSDRWNVAVDVPLQFQSYDLHRTVPRSGTTQPVPVITGANGLGDISLRAGAWIFSTEHTKGNIFASLGLEMPTGNDHATSLVYGQQVPVDISVQPGNGAWGLVPTVQGFRTFKWFSIYGVGTYLINPRNTTGTPAFFSALNNPSTTNVNSSTDQYMAEFGAAIPIPFRWVTPTLAYRMSGVPVNDLFGPSDGFRRPANLQYFAPGLDFHLFRQEISLTVPMVTQINVKPRIINGVNRNTDSTVPSFMFTVTYPLRFGGR